MLSGTVKFSLLLTVFFSIPLACDSQGRSKNSESKTSEASDTQTSAALEHETKDASVFRMVNRSAAMMGTLFECSVGSNNGEKGVAEAIEAAFAEIRRVEALMTTWNPDSYLSKVNNAAGVKSIAVPKEILDLVSESLDISRLTKGKFDISFAAMGGLWDFKTQSPRLPALSEIKKRLRIIDYKSIIVDYSKGAMRLAKKGMRIGLGAIAKGYAVDRASAVLLDRGFKDFIVYGGGDLRVSGSKGGRPFRVGVQDPRNRKRYFARFDMETEGAVVTSGDYESFFVLNGQRYHHIIDPETGFPAKGTVSVTILDKTATRADALATGIFVMGPEKGMQLIESEPTLEGVIVDDELKVHVSTGLKSRLVMTPIDVPKEED